MIYRIGLVFGLCLCLAATVAARSLYYIGESAPLPPFTLTVEGVKYSYGTQVKKPGEGNLFLSLTVRLNNLSTTAAVFRWPDCFSIHSADVVYPVDTVTNAVVTGGAGSLQPQEEKRVALSFTVPKKVYDQGALAHIKYNKDQAFIDLRFVDRFEGHLADGLVQADSGRYGMALTEYQLALDGMQAEDRENRNYLLYSMAESYSRLFMYEDAIANFKIIVEQGERARFYTESSQNLAALEQRLKAEDQKQKAVRLVETGYNYVAQLGNNVKALELFALLRREYAGIKVGEFTTDQVAVLYSAMAYINMSSYSEALALCQSELNEPRTARSPEYKKTLEETVKQCKDLIKKAK
jgi:hypothetical protein